MSNWRTHDGGCCPVDGRAEVRVRWRNGLTAVQDYRAGGLRWSDTGHDYDVASYQVTSVEDVE